MKRQSLICAIGLVAASALLASPFPDSASWQPSAGPPGGLVYVIASVNSTVFAGTKAGLYKSSDIGATWRVTGFPLKSSVGPIVEVQGVLLAGIDNDGLVRSENGGEDWQPSNEGLPNGPFVSVSSLGVVDG